MKGLAQTLSLVFALAAIALAAFLATQDNAMALLNTSGSSVSAPATSGFHVSADQTAAQKTEQLRKAPRRSPHKIYRDLQRRNMLKGHYKRTTALA